MRLLIPDDDFSRSIRRAIVDNHQFERKTGVLGENAVDRLPDEAFLIVGGQDNGELGRCRGRPVAPVGSGSTATRVEPFGPPSPDSRCV